MMRKCHMNTCPVGVATQNEELRQRFHGRYEYLVNFFTFLAEEVRGYLAEMGFTKLEQIIGRSDLLVRKPQDHVANHDLINFDKLVYLPEEAQTDARHQITKQIHQIDQVKDIDMIAHAKKAIESGEKVSLDYAIVNTDRSVGAMLSGEIAKRYGNPTTRSISSSRDQPAKVSEHSWLTASAFGLKERRMIILERA